MKETSSEVALIGAGPIGIEMAVALKKAGISYEHIEAGSLASTISWYPPNTLFFSSPERIAIAGVPLQTITQQKATREEYLCYLRSVASQFNLDIKTFNRVQKIEKSSDRFELFISPSNNGVGGPNEYEYRKIDSEPDNKPYWKLNVKKVILAIGDMHRPNKIEVRGEELAHVSHYFKEPHAYYGKKVLVVGGKNSAVEAAIRLCRAGAEVSISYRKEKFDPSSVKFWLLPEIKSLIKHGNISFLTETTVSKISKEKVELNCKESAQNKIVDADFVFLLTGHKQDSTLFEQLGVNLKGKNRQPTFSRKTMESNINGVFIAGTAVAGTQLGSVKEFIETSHVHVDRIVAKLKGGAAPKDTDLRSLEYLES